MEAAVDYDRIQILACYAGRFDSNVRNVLCSVKESVCLAKIHSLGELYSIFCRVSGKLFNGLIDRDELCAFNKSLARLKVAVLTCYKDLAGISALSKRMDGFTCKSIVAAHYRVSLGYLIKVGVYKIIGKLRSPVIAVILQRDLHSVLPADTVKAFHYLRHVVVGFGSHDLNDRAAVRNHAADGFSHFFSYGYIVKGDVEICIAVHYETVVADDRNAFILGFLKDVCEAYGISGDDDYRINADLDEVLDL